MKAKWNVALPVLLMLVFAISRWPGMMPENFSAVYALAFCAGLYFPRVLAWWLPLATLALTDLALMFLYQGRLPADSTTNYLASLGYILPNYIGYAGLIWLGRRFSARDSWLRLLGGGLLGAILFYLVSNTGAWLQNPEYAKTLAGWIQALTVGLPGWPPTWEFFRNTLMSSGLFTGLFVGAMKAAEAMEAEEEEEEEAEAAGETEEPAPEEA